MEKAKDDAALRSMIEAQKYLDLATKGTKDDAKIGSLDPRIKALSDELDKCSKWHPPSREAYCRRLLEAIDNAMIQSRPSLEDLARWAGKELPQRDDDVGCIGD